MWWAILALSLMQPSYPVPWVPTVSLRPVCSREAPADVREKRAQEGVSAYIEGGEKREKEWLAAFIKSHPQLTTQEMAELHWSLHVAYIQHDLMEKAVEHGLLAFSEGKPDSDWDAVTRIERQLSLSNTYYETGSMDKALEWVERAQETLPQVPARFRTAWSAQCQMSVGKIYHYWGRFKEAIKQMEEARRAFEQMTASALFSWNAETLANITDCYITLGILYTNSKMYEDAFALYTRARINLVLAKERYPEYKELIKQGEVWEKLGRGLALLMQKKHDASVEAFSTAVSQSQTLTSPRLRVLIAHAQAALGYALSHRKNAEKRDCEIGLRRAEEALKYYRTRSDKKLIAIGEGIRALNLAGLGNIQESVQVGLNCLEAVEAFSHQIGEDSELGAIQEIFPRPYAFTAHQFVALRQDGQALATVERGRVQGLARQAARNHVNFYERLDPADAEALKACDTAITVARKRLREAEKAGSASEVLRTEVERAERKRKNLVDILLNLRTNQKAKYADYQRALSSFTPPAVEQLTKLAAANPDTLYLEWTLLDDERTLLFAMSKTEGVRAFVLDAGADKIKGLVTKWYDNMRLVGPEEKQDARELYSVLLGPLDREGVLNDRYQRLVIIADEILLHLPFAVLLDAKGQRLFERYALSSALSLSSLLWPSESPRPEKSLFCVADPVIAKKPGRAEADFDARAMKHMREQAKRITLRFGVQPLVDREVREKDVKREMPKAALLHFGTHGRLSGSDGLRSYLLMGSEPAESAEDGRLEAKEIATMRLSAQLAVLAACNSGSGAISGGEGLIGLVWAFRAAGCPSIVASQWEVDEKITVDLMDEFYKEVTGEAKPPKDKALQTAMKRIYNRLKKSDPLHSTPYYWAAFQVIGNTDPLTLAPNKSAEVAGSGAKPRSAKGALLRKP